MKWIIFIFILVFFASCSDSKSSVVTSGNVVILTDERVTKDVGIYYPSFIVNDNSMSPRIMNGEEIFFDVNYLDLRRGDVVLLNFSGNKNLLVKQIKGVPNDSFGFFDDKIFVNGEVLTNSVGEEYSIDPKLLKLFSLDYPVIPEKTYLLLGDAVNGSIDTSSFGLVDRSSIHAKVILT